MKKALLLIDIQNDYFEGGNFPLWNTIETLNNIEQAVKKANQQNIPIILIQHIADNSNGKALFFNKNTVGSEIHSRILKIAENPKIIIKNFADSFYKTNLDEILTELKIEEILLCGMMTQNCITHTALSKTAEKYSVKILQDCCTTVDKIIHQMAINALSIRKTILEFQKAF